MVDSRFRVIGGLAIRDRVRRLSDSVREIEAADARRLLDRAYERMATELNCCGCYLGCVTVPVIALSTGLLVVSVLV
jgi:hypothetical protein